MLIQRLPGIHRRVKNVGLEIRSVARRLNAVELIFEKGDCFLSIVPGERILAETVPVLRSDDAGAHHNLVINSVWHARSLNDIGTPLGLETGIRSTAIGVFRQLAEDIDREALKTKVEAALSGAVDTLWLTDRRNREIGVSSAKIAYVEIGTPDGERKIGFGG